MSESQPGSISISYLPDNQETLDWSRQIQRLQTPWYTPFLRWALSGALLIFMAVPLLAGGIFQTLFPAAPTYTIAIFLVAILVAHLLFRRLQRLVLKLAARDALSRFDAPEAQDVRLDEYGLTIISGDTSWRGSWTAMRSVALLDGSVAFTVGLGALFIANRAFASDAARDDCIRFVLRHLSDAARARSFDTGTLAAYR